MAVVASDMKTRIGDSERRSRLPWLLALLVLLAMGAWLGWQRLAAPETFPLRAVRLDGSVSHVAEAELRAAVARHLDRGMLALDIAAIRASLEALPWIAEARVRRQWPGTLIVGLTEQEPLARWGDAALMSERGVPFAPSPDTFPEGLPQLAGPGDAGALVVERFHALRPLFERVGLRLTGLTLDERRSWTAVLDGRVVARLGSGDEAAVRRFVDAFPEIQPQGELASVDLRYPNGFALGWAAAQPSDVNKE